MAKEVKGSKSLGAVFLQDNRDNGGILRIVLDGKTIPTSKMHGVFPEPPKSSSEVISQFRNSFPQGIIHQNNPDQPEAIYLELPGDDEMQRRGNIYLALGPKGSARLHHNFNWSPELTVIRGELLMTHSQNERTGFLKRLFANQRSRQIVEHLLQNQSINVAPNIQYDLYSPTGWTICHSSLF